MPLSDEGSALGAGGWTVWIYIGLGLVWLLEPGRLVDKDRGLWTLRREFESRPGYHYISENDVHVFYFFELISGI